MKLHHIDTFEIKLEEALNYSGSKMSDEFNVTRAVADGAIPEAILVEHYAGKGVQLFRASYGEARGYKAITSSANDRYSSWEAGYMAAPIVRTALESYGDFYKHRTLAQALEEVAVTDVNDSDD